MFSVEFMTSDFDDHLIFLFHSFVSIVCWFKWIDKANFPSRMISNKQTHLWIDMTKNIFKLGQWRHIFVIDLFFCFLLLSKIHPRSANVVSLQTVSCMKCFHWHALLGKTEFYIIAFLSWKRTYNNIDFLLHFGRSTFLIYSIMLVLSIPKLNRRTIYILWFASKYFSDLLLKFHCHFIHLLLSNN